MITVNKVITGQLSENCYILEKFDHVIVIDPGSEYLKIKEAIGDKVLDAILVTHSHFDHVGALEQLATVTKADIYYKENLKEQEYKIGKFTFDVIYTEGHSDDSISFYFKEINSIFCGDFIFHKSIGRCDLPTGDEGKMIDSLEKIKKYDNSIRLYPGHGIDTTLGYEKMYNSYFNC